MLLFTYRQKTPKRRVSAPANVVNAAAVRKALEEGVARMEQAIAASQRIAWLSQTAAVVAFIAAVCAIFVHAIR
jgi:hypothetical protein